MHVLEKPTLVTRQTVVQSFRQILPSEGAGIMRRLQVLVPMNPNVYIILTPDERFKNDDGAPLKNMAVAAGYDRNYQGVLLPPGAQIVLHLLPEQSLWACCEINYAEVGLICEYMAIPGAEATTLVPVAGSSIRRG